MPDPINVAGIFHDVTGKPFNSDRTAVRRLNQLLKLEEHMLVILPIDKLRATQPTVNADYKEAALRHLPGESTFPPATVKYKSIYYITDGHHRLVALHFMGATRALVRLYALDGDTQTDMPILDFLGL